eukprot:gene29290-36313_t
MSVADEPLYSTEIQNNGTSVTVPGDVTVHLSTRYLHGYWAGVVGHHPLLVPLVDYTVTAADNVTGIWVHLQPGKRWANITHHSVSLTVFGLYIHPPGGKPTSDFQPDQTVTVATV